MEEEFGGESVHPPTLEQQNPEFVSVALDAGFSIIYAYGWYTVAFAVSLYFLWRRKIKSMHSTWKQQLDDKAYAAKYHKDPNLFQARQESMEAARRKMQVELEIKSQGYIEKQKEIEEAKRLEKIADWERHEKGLGYKSKFKEEDNSGTSNQRAKSSLRPDYNPLMGSGGSSGYRPPRRSCCSGGGCG